MDVRIIGDPGVGDYLRLFVGGPKGNPPTELIIHHPIGVTDLDDDAWVISSTDDTKLLVARKKDPNQGTLATRREAWVREQAVEKGLILISTAGKVTYPNGADRTEWIKTLKEEALISNADNPKYIFTIDGALAKCDENDVLANFEREYRKSLVSLSREAEGAIPQTYRTLGGQLADKPQEENLALKGKSIFDVQNHIVRHGVSEPLPQPKAEEEKGERLGLPDGTSFSVTGFPKEARAYIRTSLANMAKNVRTKYGFEIEAAVVKKPDE
jgi:hypothetical protein